MLDQPQIFKVKIVLSIGIYHFSIWKKIRNFHILFYPAQWGFVLDQKRKIISP